MHSERGDSFIDHAPVPMAILDDHFRFVKVNQSMAKVHQITSEAHLGKTFAEVLPSVSTLIEPLLAKVLATGEPAEVEITGEPAYLDTTRNWLAVCFPSGESEIAFMAVEANDRRIEEALGSTKRHLASALADLEQSALVSEMGHSLQGAVIIEELYRIVGRFAPRLFPRNSGALFLIDSSRNVIEAVAAWGDSSASESVFSPGDCWALRKGRAHLVSDPQSGSVCPHAARDGQYAQICVPMMAQSETLGFLHLQSRVTHSSGEAFTERELRLIDTVAEEIALSLANVGLREILRNQAFRDPLTGLYNRRFLQEALDLELRRAARKCLPLGLGMLDVDGFKKINDAYGHGAGDWLLQSVATLLQSRVRTSDVVCRYGGDEFSIVMPETSVQDAIRRAGEWRSAVELLSTEWKGQILAGVTISIGVAAYPICTTSDELFREADSALYSAKVSGRDQVQTSPVHHRRPAAHS